MARKKQTSIPRYVEGGIKSTTDFKRMNEFHDKYKRGDYQSLSDKTSYSPSYVWRVMNNERGQNSTIISTARQMVRNRKTQLSDYNW